MPSIQHQFTIKTKNLSCTKGEAGTDHRTGIRWFKIFHLDCKNLNNQTRSGR